MSTQNLTTKNVKLNTDNDSWTFTSSTSNVSIGVGPPKNDTWPICFKDKNGNTVGELKIENGTLTFEGDADKSAQKFFESLVKDKVKQYIKDNHK